MFRHDIVDCYSGLNAANVPSERMFSVTEAAKIASFKLGCDIEEMTGFCFLFKKGFYVKMLQTVKPPSPSDLKFKVCLLVLVFCFYDQTHFSSKCFGLFIEVLTVWYSAFNFEQGT